MFQKPDCRSEMPLIFTSFESEMNMLRGRGTSRFFVGETTTPRLPRFFGTLS